MIKGRSKIKNNGGKKTLSYKMIKTNPQEFIKFNTTLMSNAPKGYIPWYFPVIEYNKAPDGLAISKCSPPLYDGKKGNWKAPWSRLTYKEALERLKEGKNVGISGRKDDPLIIIDIDDWNLTNQAPKTLIILSRKRCGIHAFCWKHPDCRKLPLNIPTDFGEVRSSDQYVVAAGSYCKTSCNDIDGEPITDKHKTDIKNDPNLGVYSIMENVSPCFIKYEELPVFFLDKEIRREEKENNKPEYKNKVITLDGKKSALFDLKITDIISTTHGNRKPHPLHSSDTGMNFSVDDNLSHCWRHLVSLNAIQFLVVKSGYMSCLDAGTGHINSGAGTSKVTGDDGAIFYAWKEAKKMGIIPINDPIPVRALKYIAHKHELIPSEYTFWKLPVEIYNKVIKIIEGEY